MGSYERIYLYFFFKYVSMTVGHPPYKRHRDGPWLLAVFRKNIGGNFVADFAIFLFFIEKNIHIFLFLLYLCYTYYDCDNIQKLILLFRDGKIPMKYIILYLIDKLCFD